MSLFLSLSTGSLFWRIIIRRPHLSAGYSGFYINCFTASRQRTLPPSFDIVNDSFGPTDKLKYKLQQRKSLKVACLYTPGPPVDLIRSGLQPQKHVDQRIFFFKSLVRAYSLSTLLTHHLCPFVQFILIVSTNNGNVYCIITYNDVRCPTCLFPNHKPTE